MGANTSNENYDLSEFKKKISEEDLPAVESCDQSSSEAPLAGGVPIGDEFFGDKSGMVHIKTLGGHVFPLSADPGDSIKTLKEKIQREVKVPLKELNLLYAGQKLEDDKNLSDYGIRHETTIHFIIGDKDSTQTTLESHSQSIEGQCEINILYQKQKVPLKIQVTGRKVKDLKVLVSNTICRPDKEFVLLYGGKLLLEEEKNLTEYGIVDQSNLIAIAASDGGDCLKFTQLVLETMIKDLAHLKSSLDFLPDKQKTQRLVTIAQNMVKNIKRIKPELKNASEEGLVSIILWTSDILHGQLNEALRGSDDFSRWNIYLKHFLNGLKFMPFFRGTVYCGFNKQQDLDIYRKKGFITWKTISAFSRNEKVAEIFAGGQGGVIFEVEVFSARDISSISLMPSEEEVVMLPHSCFKVIDVIEVPGNPVKIKLREMPTPRAPKVAFWTDDNPENNHAIAKTVEQKDISCVFCVSTKDALNVIEKYRWLLYFESANFKIVTDVVREEDGVVNYSAGVDLVEKLVKDYQYNFEIMICCGDVQSAQEKCNARQLKGRFSITSYVEKVEQFLTLFPGTSFKVKSGETPASQVVDHLDDFDQFKKYDDEPPAVEVCAPSSSLLSQVVEGVLLVPIGHDFFYNKSGKIFVKTMAGQAMEISVDPGDLVRTIKGKIQEQTGIFPDDQIILYAGQKLRDDRSLSDYNIQHNTTVNLLLGNEDPSHFHCQEDEFELYIFYQQCTFRLQIQPTKKVKDLKIRIADAISQSAIKIVLLYGGKLLLDEEKDLVKAGILKGSNVIVISYADGGACLRFTQLVLEEKVKDLHYLKSSLDFLNKQQMIETFVTLAKNKIKEIKKQKLELKNTPEEALVAIMLWTSNILFQQLNRVLRECDNFSEWNVYLKNFLNGLKVMPYYRGTVYRGFRQQQDLEIYRKGGLINWKTMSAFSKKFRVAQRFSSPLGMIFEAEVFSSRDISSISEFMGEEEVIMLPYSCFEVLKVIEEPGKPVYIKLREVPTPRAPKVLFWTDNLPEGNHVVGKEVEEKDISCVFCVSTNDALKVIEKYRWLLHFENGDFKIVTGMVRNEGGVVNLTAGIDVVEKLVRDYHYNFEILIFCEDVKNSQQKCDTRKLKGRFSITSCQRELQNFLNLNKEKIERRILY